MKQGPSSSPAAPRLDTAGISDQRLRLASLAPLTIPALRRPRKPLKARRALCQQDVTGLSRPRNSGLTRGDGCHLASHEKLSKESWPISPPGGLRATESGKLVDGGSKH